MAAQTKAMFEAQAKVADTKRSRVGGLNPVVSLGYASAKDAKLFDAGSSTGSSYDMATVSHAAEDATPTSPAFSYEGGIRA